MGLLDFIKKVEKPISKKWIARLDDREYFVQSDFNMLIDDALMKIEEDEAEFFVLSPPVPVNNFTFLQVCLDNKPEFMHIELGLNEKLENGRPKILAHDMVTVDEVLDLFIQFYNAQIIDTTEWYVLK